MLNKLQNEWRTPVIFMLLVIMLISLFVSRALLSLSMIAFVLFSFIHNDLRGQLRRFLKSPVGWSGSVLFLIPLVSGAWSSDMEQWLDIVRIKAPLIVLPLAFAAPFGLSEKHRNNFILILLIIVGIATIWTTLHYIGDISAVNESYLRAKTMNTPLENDHVRFSWLVSVALLIGLWNIEGHRGRKDWKFWVQFVLIVWYFIFLHMLGARTGLICAYLVVAAFLLNMAIDSKRRRKALTFIGVLLLMPLAAYLLLPSFRNRIKYIRYDFSYLKEDKYLAGSSDAVRSISLKAGWQLMNDHPATGVGFGDIQDSMQRVYDSRYPGMIESDRILPSSEWLIYGSGTGWPGFILFTLAMLIPFFTGGSRWAWWVLNTVAALSLLFDIGLEVQFGVFVYSFITCLCWKWMIMEKV